MDKDWYQCLRCQAPDRGIDQHAKAELKKDILQVFGDCGFIRHLYDMDDTPSLACENPVVTLSDPMPWNCPELAFSHEVTLASYTVRNESEVVTLCERCRTALYDAVGVGFVEDGDKVSQSTLHAVYQKLLKAERLSSTALVEIVLATRDQHNSARWLAEHVSRITSSSAHKIFRRRSTTQPDKIVSAIM